MERQYKDSGIEWIGKIPKEWETVRLKSLFTERNERECTGKTLLSVSQYFGIRPKSETDLADSHIAESYDDYKEVHKGDFVMNIMLAWNGSYAVSEYDGIVSPAYCVFKFRKDSCNKYFHYLLRTEGYPTAFKTMSRGVIDSRLRLYPEQFYTFPVVIPPLPEQQRIASYLDKKCGEIDELIALQEKMIAQLTEYKQAVITEAVTKGLDPNAKLVPSGIEWIGDVPEGWKVPRIKNVLENNKNSLRVGPFGSALSGNDIVDIGYWVYNQRTVLDDNFRDNDSFINEAKYKELLSFKVYNGDILLTTRGTIGKIAIVPQNFNEGIIHPCIIRFRVDHVLIDKIYLKFLFNGTNIIANQVRYNSNSTTIDVIYSNTLKELYLPVPPLPDQQRIASYLDTKCSEIDSLITLKRQKIESLNAYKKSVIYEAVTGKTMI